MELSLRSLDWSLVRVFLSVAECGSLSAAARELGSSQPTVGRQIQALENSVGAVLFHRRAKGMHLSDAGAALVAPAREMREAANSVSLILAGSQQQMAGTVRVTASVFTAHHILPSIIAGIRDAEPEIAIELVASDQSENLLYREADIAVRMYRPTQLDVVTRHLGDVPLGLYGARQYLDRVGRPELPAELLDLTFVGYDRDERIIRGFREAGWEVGRDFFPVRCDQNTVHWELVRAGCGVGFAPRFAAEKDPNMEEIDPGIPIPSLPVWLTAHEVMRRTPRIRRVYEILSDQLGALLS